MEQDRIRKFAYGMDPEKFERLAETCNPMEEINWTLWQALAWVRDRDVNNVRECMEIWAMVGPLGGVRKIWKEIGPDYKTTKAMSDLWRALELGTLPGTGIEAVTGNRREIGSLEWYDLVLGSIEPNASGESRVYLKGFENLVTIDNDVSPIFRDIRVRVADVLNAFPSIPSTASGRRRHSR